MENVTYNELLTTIIVLMIGMGVYNTIMTAIKNHREEKRFRNAPLAKIDERLDAHDKYLSDDKSRINTLEGQARNLEREFQLVLKSQLALLRHGIDGNNIDGLKQSQTDIQNYLINK